MIHLNQKNGEKDKILELINSAIDKPNYELECETHAKDNWNELVIDKEESIKKRFESLTRNIIADINSIKENLLVMDNDTVVYCGHGQPTKIGFEKINNPFLK